MTKTSKAILTCSALVASLALSQPVNAATIFASIGGAPIGVNLLNFDDLALGTGTPQTADGPTAGASAVVTLTPNAAVVNTSSSGVFAQPFLSGSNGNGFGAPNQPNGQDTTPYITTGSTGAFAGAAVKLSNFSGTNQLLQYFGLLWGSVDTYNTLSFYNGAALVDTVLGSQVIAAALSNPGSQAADGTVYVNIATVAAFDSVVFTSSQYAFEFDNAAYSVLVPGELSVPDGGTTSVLLGLALTGVGLLRRRML